jgi:hypothetical protein
MKGHRRDRIVDAHSPRTGNVIAFAEEMGMRPTGEEIDITAFT